MSQVSPEAKAAIYGVVSADLKPSFLAVFLRIFLSMVLGGVLSLFVCGQFGVAFTSLAVVANELLHSNLEPLYCSVLCGAIFAIFQVMALRLISSGVLFQTLIKGHWQLQLLMAFVHGLAMYTGGSQTIEFYHVLVWSIGVALGFRFLGEGLVQIRSLFIRFYILTSS